MALPPVIQKQKIKKRLLGLEGKAKIKEIKKILEELPGYFQGDYGIIRKNLMEEIKKTTTRSKIKYQDWLGVIRQGDKQFCLVGAPSVGKSSLLSKLSGMKIKTAAYSFTTLKPIPSIVKLNGAQVQIVDLPGLIGGATEDIGGGKRLLGIVRNTDGIIFMIDLTKDYSEAEAVWNELLKARIEKPIIIVANKIDAATSMIQIEHLKKKFKENLVLISVLTGAGLDVLKERIWKNCNLIRIYTENTKEPMVIRKGSTVKEAVGAVHKKLLDGFKWGILNGKSAKFPNQKVGLNHVVEDEDRLKIVSKN
jgi:small GTP-binding protein